MIYLRGHPIYIFLNVRRSEVIFISSKKLFIALNASILFIFNY